MAMIATKPLTVTFPTSPQQCRLVVCTVTLEELSAVRTGLQRLAPGCTQNTRACSMFTQTQLPSLPPPSPVQHTQNPSTKENILVMRHLNDNWRVPMKRPSLHSEVGQTEESSFSGLHLLLVKRGWHKADHFIISQAWKRSRTEI